MAPTIVWAGAGGGAVVSLLCVMLVFTLKLPPALAAILIGFFGVIFLASAVIFGRLLVID